MVKKYNQKLFFSEEKPKETQLHEKSQSFFFKSGSILPHSGQYCHGIARDDYTVSYVVLMQQRCMAP